VLQRPQLVGFFCDNKSWPKAIRTRDLYRTSLSKPPAQDRCCLARCRRTSLFDLSSMEGPHGNGLRNFVCLTGLHERPDRRIAVVHETRVIVQVESGRKPDSDRFTRTRDLDTHFTPLGMSKNVGSQHLSKVRPGRKRPEVQYRATNGRPLRTASR
jgi:hypothetical protein